MADDCPHFSSFYIHVQRMFDTLGPRVAEHFGPVPVDDLERGRYYSLLSGEFIRALERTFQVSPDEKRQLLESIAQAGRGDFVDADELLSEIDEVN
jgi:hypothetical protein